MTGSGHRVKGSDPVPSLLCHCVYIGWKWQGLAGSRLINNRVEEAMAAANVTDCMNRCILNPDCISVNYRSSDSSCELNARPSSGFNPDDIVDDGQWMYWNITADLVF